MNDVRDATTHEAEEQRVFRALFGADDRRTSRRWEEINGKWKLIHQDPEEPPTRSKRKLSPTRLAPFQDLPPSTKRSKLSSAPVRSNAALPSAATTVPRRSYSARPSPVIEAKLSRELRRSSVADLSPAATEAAAPAAATEAAPPPAATEALPPPTVSMGCQTNPIELLDAPGKETLALDAVRCKFSEARLRVSLGLLAEALPSHGFRTLADQGLALPQKDDIDLLNAEVEGPRQHPMLLGLFPGSFPNRTTVSGWGEICNLRECAVEGKSHCVPAEYVTRGGDDVWRFEQPTVFAASLETALHEARTAELPPRQVVVPLVSGTRLMSAVLVLSCETHRWWAATPGSDELRGVKEFMAGFDGGLEEETAPSYANISNDSFGAEDSAVILMFWMESLAIAARTELEPGCLYGLRYLYAQRLASTLGSSEQELG